MATTKDANKPLATWDEAGHLLVTLPVSKTCVRLRGPKGKDMRQIASVEGGEYDYLYKTLELLSDGQVTFTDLDEMDAQDLKALGGCLPTYFPVFSA